MRKPKQQFKSTRTATDVREERDAGFVHIRDYGRDHDIEMMWDFNDAVKKDRIFKLKISSKGTSKTVYLDVDELQRYMRWV